MSNRFDRDSGNGGTPPRSYNRYITESNQNPRINHRFITQSQNQYQNLVSDNQALENAFSRLSVSNHNPNSGIMYGVNPLDDVPYYNYGIQAQNTSIAFDRGFRNNNIVNGGEISPFSPFYMSADRDSYGFNNSVANGDEIYPFYMSGDRDSYGFSSNIANGGEISQGYMSADRDSYWVSDYPFLSRQSVIGGNNLLNGGGGDRELRREFQCGLSNESLSVANVSWRMNNNISITSACANANHNVIANANVNPNAIANVNPNAIANVNPNAIANANVNGNVYGNENSIGKVNNQHWFYGVQGRVYLMAKDQNESRILQDVIEKFENDGVSRIFDELIIDVNELMTDPFGNYVIQKMVDFCNHDQITVMVRMVTLHCNELIRICLNPYGSRAVEQMLENVTTREQRTLIMSALSPGALVLSKDINAHRVVLYCMKNFTHEDTKEFLTFLASNTYPIAKDKTGCCVLQQCISHAQGETKNQLMNDIIFNARILSEDCYGNYVVQHLLTLKIPGVAESLYRHLEGQFVSISCNKYGSNVVEKFLLNSETVLSGSIMLELLQDPNVSRLLVDPYGNYVISTALEKYKDNPIFKNALLDLIKENSHMMRSNMFGKKLLDKSDKEIMMRRQI